EQSQTKASRDRSVISLSLRFAVAWQGRYCVWLGAGASNGFWRHQGARSLAAELLAETENGRLLVRDLRRTRGGLLRMFRTRKTNQQFVQVETQPMNTPYGLSVVENCTTCKLRKDGWYCSLPEELMKAV